MIIASALEIRATLNDLEEIIGRHHPEAKTKKLRRTNDLLFAIAYSHCERLYHMLESFLGRTVENFPAFVNGGFCANASDSLMLMFQRYPEHVAELAVRMKADETLVRLEVEDNGTGIDPAVEQYLFYEQIDSKKTRGKLKNVYHGGTGLHLYGSKRRIDKLSGRIGHINKGKNWGALFWYEIPLEKLLVKK
ncbi:MAG: ATP-binding protein [Nanoarchaeota archaeon]|nr:ATP-binding protein [Nanoarchaeota archaeon]